MKHNLHRKEFFCTELTARLQLGEICGLLCADFDERKEILNVSRTLYMGKGGTLMTGDTKTYAGTRKIILSNSTAELLQNHKKHSILRMELP